MWHKKSTYIIGLLTVLLIGISLFVYIIMVPYTNYHNELDTIESTIIEQEGLKNVQSFEKYNGSEVYYIIQTKAKVYVYNQDLERVYRRNITRLAFDEVEGLFNKEDYESIKEELGYENEKLCYVYTLYTSSTVEYRYYNLESGQLMKMYSLKRN